MHPLHSSGNEPPPLSTKRPQRARSAPHAVQPAASKASALTNWQRTNWQPWASLYLASASAASREGGASPPGVTDALSGVRKSAGERSGVPADEGVGALGGLRQERDRRRSREASPGVRPEDCVDVVRRGETALGAGAIRKGGTVPSARCRSLDSIAPSVR